ncbi:PAAR-like domain-containing protein [Aminobacter sp. HY435]|uniref:PAAR-like domain-containing protein n=1 Tax=Aminobacter sp. HY435 TaxID=2970917 RepID=UPI0022B9CF3F|nr:PAAR-like domain-containing protein [Aminobacter sp. HY435]
MTVYANGLEVACKVQANKIIAAFPYVCFTPPQTPATPPGVPVPYPTFSMDDDTDSGTSTVKIGGKTVTQKNKSYYTKCSGNEAGCAPKKNIITSVNRGKEYAHAWSGNVKMDAEPISRFSDLGSNDHASPMAGGMPILRVATATAGDFKCSMLGIKPYDQLECDPGYEKEHTTEVRFFTVQGVRDLTLDCCKDYDEQKAPCICMKAKWMPGEAAKARKAGYKGQKVIGKKGKTGHNLKTQDAAKWIKDNDSGKLGDFNDVCAKATVKHMKDPEIPKEIHSKVAQCLKDKNADYQKKNIKSNDVKEKTRCHGSCPKAQDQAKKASKARKKLKDAAVKAGKDPKNVTVTAADVGESSKECPK